MTGCGNSGQMIYDPNAQGSSQEILSSADASGADSASASSESGSADPDTAQDEPDYDDLDELTSGKSKYPLRNWLSKAIGDNAFTDHFVGSDDEDALNDMNDWSLFCFTEQGGDPEKLKIVDDENLPYHDGNAEMDLNLLLYAENACADYSVTTSMMLIVNGQVYDFSVDGKQSTDGILTMDLPYNQDLVYPFDMSGVPVQTGENEMMFWIFPYCEQKNFYLSPQSFTGYFTADKAADGLAPVSTLAQSDIRGLVTETTDGLSKEEILRPDKLLTFTDQQYLVSAQDGGRTLTVKANAPLHFEMLNMNNDLGPSNRSGYCMVFSNGRLLPAFQGKQLAELSFRDTELFYSVPFDTDFHAGDTAFIRCYYVQYENDKDAVNPFELTEQKFCFAE